MQYLSTRGGISPISFSQAVMMGLASDGGLLLPRNIPKIGAQTFSSWSDLSYVEVAFEIMSRFIDDIPSSSLRDLINRSYATFTAPEVVPLAHHGNLHILELFHGPTLAFKDIALQFLGNLFEYLLEKEDSYLNIVGATSGDTGSAAIYGVRGKERIKIFILHPHNRISPVQERQMTTVEDSNVYNIAIDGTFDHGQAIIKELFNNLEFKHNYHLGAINSINWARILAQVVYYVYSCLHVIKHEGDKAMDFSVPTGNFGDIFAGYIAKHLLPEGTIRKLILATNANDILSRFVTKGDYSKNQVQGTSSPSMDIQAASNFERYLYYLLDKNGNRTAEAMLEFSENGNLKLSNYRDQVKRDFAAAAITDEEVETVIGEFKKDHGYLLDPHTAVGVRAGQQFQQKNIPMVCLATAHPAKFADTVKKATGVEPRVPEQLVGLFAKNTRCEVMPADRDRIKDFICSNALTVANE